MVQIYFVFFSPLTSAKQTENNTRITTVSCVVDTTDIKKSMNNEANSTAMSWCSSFLNPSKPQQEIIMQKLKLNVANSEQTDSRGMWPVFGGVVLSSSIHLLPISTYINTLA